MPVTAKLSKLFYDRLGEQIADELVDWFNQVDAASRSDIRELIELNFARFDAKLEQRMAQMESKLEQRLAQMDAKLEQRMAQMDAKLAQLQAEFRASIAELETRMERRLFAAWATLMIAIIGLWLRR